MWHAEFVHGPLGPHGGTTLRGPYPFKLLQAGPAPADGCVTGDELWDSIYAQDARREPDGLVSAQPEVLLLIAWRGQQLREGGGASPISPAVKRVAS